MSHDTSHVVHWCEDCGNLLTCCSFRDEQHGTYKRTRCRHSHCSLWQFAYMLKLVLKSAAHKLARKFQAPTLYRRRPLSTKTQCRRSPSTLCTSVAATVLSTPPDRAQMTWSSGPTCTAASVQAGVLDCAVTLNLVNNTNGCDCYYSMLR